MKINVQIQSLRERNVTNPGCTKHFWQCVVAFINIVNSKCAVWKPFEWNWITGKLRFSFEEKTSDLADNSVLVVSTRQRSMPHHGGLLVSCIDREIDCCPSLSGLPTLWNFKSYVNLLTLGSMWQCELTTCRETTFAQAWAGGVWRAWVEFFPRLQMMPITPSCRS